MGSWTLSDALGYISICCWLGAQFPQVIENARRKSVDGLSLPFLANWFLGDFTNLVGCILTHQLPFQTYLATYFVFVDFSILGQYYYYRKPSPPATPYLRARATSFARTRRMSEDRGHYRSLSVAAANVATTAAIAATQQEVQSPRARRHSRISLDEIPEPVRSPIEMTDDEDYDEEVLARLADSIQSEGGRSRKHVSWNPVSQGRRSGSLDPSSQQPFPSRRPTRPFLQIPDPREAEPDVRGRPQQREVDTEDGWRGSENPTPTSARLSRSRAGRRSASLVFLGFWALFGVGTLVGSRRSLPSTSSVSIGRVLTPMDDPALGAFDPSKAIKFDHEPEDFSWIEIPAGAINTDHQDSSPPKSGPSIERIIGRMSAWACTTLYLTSRLPQIWKNFTRKSVEGLSMYLFVFAFLGNTFYVSSILTSSKLDIPGPEASAYIQESIPYLLGSAGTLMFDVTIVSQSFLYRKLTDKEKAIKRNFRAGRSIPAEEEGLLSGGATGADDGASPQHRRRTVSDTDDNV